MFDVNQTGVGPRIFQFWFDDAFNAWCGEEILSEFRKYLYLHHHTTALQRKFDVRASDFLPQTNR